MKRRAILVLMLAHGVSTAGCGMCGNEPLSEHVSPDGAAKIVIFQRDCGATTGFSTQASLIDSEDALPESGGNVFSADTNHGAAPSGAGGGPELSVRWEGPNRVVLRHHRAARIFKAERRSGEVEVGYETFP